MQATLPKTVSRLIHKTGSGVSTAGRDVCRRLASTAAEQTSIGPSKERLLLEKIANRSGFHWADANQWYSLPLEKFSNKAEKDLLNKYDNNLYQALLDHFPSIQLLPWRFPGGAIRCLSDPLTRRQFLEYLREQLDIKDDVQWRTRLSSAKLKKLGVIVPVKSLKIALAEEYPHVDWSSVFGSSIGRSRAGFTQPAENSNFNQLNFTKLKETQAAFEQLHQRLNLPAGLAGWYRVLSKQLESDPVVQAFLVANKGSLFLSLKSLYPAHDWQEWRLGPVPRNFWGDPTNCARFFNHIVPDDLSRWYNITQEEVKLTPGGAGVLAHYGQLSAALTCAFPNHKWEMWKFSKPGTDVAANKDLHRPFLEEVSKNLGITSLDQWYQISSKQLKSSGLSRILHNYGDSVAKMLVSNYPEHEWDLWRLPGSGDWWTQPAVVKRFLEAESKQIGVKSFEDWYFVKDNQLSFSSPTFDLPTALEIAYPSHKWESWRFGSKKREWSPIRRPRRSAPAPTPPQHRDIPTKEEDPKRRALRNLYQKVMGVV